MPGSATESDYIEQLDEARKECARERERRMELERAFERVEKVAKEAITMLERLTDD